MGQPYSPKWFLPRGMFTVSNDSTVLQSTERLRVLSIATHGLCFFRASQLIAYPLESVRGKYGSLSTELARRAARCNIS